MTDTATAPLEDARPLVASPVSNRNLWLFAGVAGLAALLLFSALEARRADRTDRELGPAKNQDGAMIEQVCQPNHLWRSCLAPCCPRHLDPVSMGRSRLPRRHP